jgi:16S rRNA (guanine966-N2)-methyltransferase
MRIISGEFRGRKIHAPRGMDTRPTTDRVRESIFNLVEHGVRSIEGARVLDLFAGSGAMGLEALSRGAGFCLFVDEAVAARGAIRRNVEEFGLTGRTRIFRRDAARLGGLPANAGGPFDVIFCDPPYGRSLGVRALESALRGGWAAPGAAAVLEENVKSDIPVPDGWREVSRRVYGETAVVVFHCGRD